MEPVESPVETYTTRTEDGRRVSPVCDLRRDQPPTYSQLKHPTKCQLQWSVGIGGNRFGTVAPQSHGLLATRTFP